MVKKLHNLCGSTIISYSKIERMHFLYTLKNLNNKENINYSIQRKIQKKEFFLFESFLWNLKTPINNFIQRNKMLAFHNFCFWIKLIMMKIEVLLEQFC